jgi:hypothetical protein
VSRQFRCARSLVLIALASVSLIGHDLYILPQTFRNKPGVRLGFAFNNGDSFPVSESAPVIARLQEAQLRSSRATIALQDLHVAGNSVVGSVNLPEAAGSMFLSVHTRANLIELQAGKFLEYLKEEGLDDVISWRENHGEASKPGRERYSKFAKALVVSEEPDDFYKTALGLAIEIIPEENPAGIHAGRALSIRVMLHGKPVGGLQVEASWSAGAESKIVIIGRTDHQGRIPVPISARGTWRLHTLAMERCAEPAIADWESSWASLTFEVR